MDAAFASQFPLRTESGTLAAVGRSLTCPSSQREIVMNIKKEKAVTAEYWSDHIAESNAFSPELYWLALPAVQKRYQLRACAGKNHPSWVHYCLEEFLGNRTPVERMLSVGCGTGGLERDLNRLSAFRHCDAIDMAPGAIELARREAAANHASTIHYDVRDIERSDLPRSHYDVIWFNGSLHHIGELETVCALVRDALKPSGRLFFNEYVGPNHFDFGERQQEAMRNAFNLIPTEYRRSYVPGNAGKVQETVPLPDPAEVSRVDPSEAVRSQDILSVVRDHFEILALNACGGSLLQFLLHGIAGNFKEDDPRSMRILQMLFDIEDALIDSGSLQSDFVVVAATPKN